MSTYDGGLDVMLGLAGETLTQYCFVKVHTDGTIMLADATTDIPVGIVQNNPATDEAAVVRILGISKVLVATGGIASPGLKLKPHSTTGRATTLAVADTSTNLLFMAGLSLETSSAGDIASCLLMGTGVINQGYTATT